MELVIIILAIVFSVWSEINKQKQEKNLDIDFSELASIDEFLKTQTTGENATEAEVKSLQPGLSRQEQKNQRIQQKKARKISQSRSNNDLPDHHVLSNSNERSLQIRENLNQSLSDAKGTALPDSAAMPTAFSTTNRQQDQSNDPPGIKLGRENLVQAFVISEVLKRYDINRIYERIPGVHRDQD